MKYKLEFIHKEQIAQDSWVLMFKKPDGFAYEPGQYIEVDLEHKNHDDRGIKRWFTLSSSPTEGDLMIATRFVEGRRSSFKDALFSLQPGQTIDAGQAEGSFIMPADTTKEIVWIAGGIGVTPFRSQTKFLLDNQEYSRKITLIYSNRTQADICFEDLWARAVDHMPGFKIVQTLVDEIPGPWAGERGMIDEEMILRAVGNIENKDFYISGPEPMVDSFIPKLEAMGIDENKIHKDRFPNYTEKFFKIN